MKFYQGKLLKSKVQQQIDYRTETRDAIVYDTIPLDRIARVKIQGSDTFVYAHYPMNWETTPVWLKQGNAVTIRHTAGNRSRIELVGHGSFIPTPVPGGTGTPSSVVAGNTVMDGCQITFNGDMTINIASGHIRIDGTIYALTGATLTFDASTGFRIDTVYAGVDGILHIEKGSDTGGVPSKPPAPEHTVELCFVFLYANMGEIHSGDINRYYGDAVMTYITATPNPATIDWDHSSSSIFIQLLDQYGRPMSNLGGDDPDYDITVTIATGNGTLSVGGQSGTSVTTHMQLSSTYVNYTRPAYEVGVPDSYGQSPAIYIQAGSGLSKSITIGLLGPLGGLLIGGGGEGELPSNPIQEPPSSDSITIDWGNGDTVKITLDRVLTTITMTDPQTLMRLKLLNDGTAGRQVSFADTVYWRNNGTSFPGLTLGAGQWAWITLVYDGEVYSADITQPFGP